jgi:Flp pilus assembly protein TadD
MTTVRFATVMALFLFAVLLNGCCCDPEQAETTAVTGGEAGQAVEQPAEQPAEAAPEPAEAAPAAAEGVDLSPPTDGKSFKAQRMANAIRGLTYDSGRVVVDAKNADPLPDAEAFANADEAYQRGLYYLFDRNDRVAAIGALTRSVIMAPDNPEHLSALGQALLRKGKRDEAVAAFRTALDLAPDHFETSRQMAFAMQMGGDYAAARDAWLRVLELDPDHGEAHGRMAVLLYYLEDYAGAWDHVTRARDLGYGLPPHFLPLLREKMPEPVQT